MSDRRVCWTHGRVNVCRTGLYTMNPTPCQWRTDEASVNAVVSYQLNERRDWK